MTMLFLPFTLLLLTVGRYGSFPIRPMVVRLSQRMSPPLFSQRFNPEEKLKLEGFLDPCQDTFLKTIIEYGNARMARRAVGVLAKMKAYKCTPTSAHYAEVLWACEKSQQIQEALGVLESMHDYGVPVSLYGYAAVISCAEKAGEWEESIRLLNELKAAGLVPTTEIYNSCMWAADRGGHWELALDMLYQMESEGVPRNEVTYSACAWACEKGSQGQIALHVLDLMHKEGIPMNGPTYGAVIWSCVKCGMATKALELFDKLQEEGLTPDIDTFTAAIWACDTLVNARRAIELLKLAKFQGLRRQTSTFDAALSTLMKAGDWENCLDLLFWMQRDGVDKSELSYKTVLHALDHAGKHSEMTEIYSQALLDGYFSPWVEGTRSIDLRDFSTPIAKAAIKNVFTSIQDGKMPVFNLGIIYGDVQPPSQDETDCTVLISDVGPERHCIEDHFPNQERHLDAEEFKMYLNSQVPGIEIKEEVKGDHFMMIITRESLLKWIESTSGAKFHIR